MAGAQILFFLPVVCTCRGLRECRFCARICIAYNGTSIRAQNEHWYLLL
jgi:hypothetical protein